MEVRRRSAIRVLRVLRLWGPGSLFLHRLRNQRGEGGNDLVRIVGHFGKELAIARRAGAEHAAIDRGLGWHHHEMAVAASLGEQRQMQQQRIAGGRAGAVAGGVDEFAVLDVLLRRGHVTRLVGLPDVCRKLAEVGLAEGPAIGVEPVGVVIAGVVDLRGDASLIGGENFLGCWDRRVGFA